jgi:hypothetical protein
MAPSPAGAALACLVLAGVATFPAAAATTGRAPVVPQIAAEKPLAVSDYEVDGVQVELLSVQRVSDGTITVRWQYRNTTDQPKQLGESFKGMGWSEPFSLVYDAYLVDARGKMKYPVLKDDRGGLVAGKHAGRKVVTLGPKRTLGAWAKFAAPPAAATKISVFIPGAQPFEEISIGS